MKRENALNRKETLSRFVEYESKQKGIVVIRYELEWSIPDDENFVHIQYQIPIQNRPYMTINFIKSYSCYKNWELIYLRKFKLDKLMKKIKNGI